MRLGLFGLPLWPWVMVGDGPPSLTQGNMSVEEYTREFEKLLIKCDIQEPEEQTIVRDLGGLDPRYSNVVEL